MQLENNYYAQNYIRNFDQDVKKSKVSVQHRPLQYKHKGGNILGSQGDSNDCKMRQQLIEQEEVYDEYPSKLEEILRVISN